MNCTCDTCKNACLNRPGFFLPEEIGPAAKSKNLSIKEFFDKYLVVDYILGGRYYKRTVFILAPSIIGSNIGMEASFNPNGRCIFFNKKELCDIHSVNNIIIKPRECAFSDHIISEKNYRKERIKIIKAWDNKEAQDMIKTLLGREPVPPTPTMGDMAQMLPSLDPFLNK